MKSLTTSLIAISLLFAGHLTPVDAGEKTDEMLADCVTLSPQHQGARFGSQYLAIRDGDKHYRLEFGGTCSALNSGSIVVSTDKQANRLCGTGTVVKSKAGNCTARAVTLIDADEYERYARRTRR